MKRICVFCGSNFGARPLYRDAAKKLGESLARRGVELVYGGGNVGLMGAVADAVLARGGKVIGVIPESMKAKELAHAGLTELRVVSSMHERKALMAELADGFIALPGGLGTFEEFCEMLTWAQLGFHRKPCALLNAGAYYNPLLALFDHAVEEGFVHAAHRDIVIVGDDAEQLLEKMAAYQAPAVEKWLGRGET